MMNEYEQWLYDSIIVEKLGAILQDAKYKELRAEQHRLQKELEDQITGAQRRMLRRQEEIAVQLSGMDMELLFSETISLAWSLFLGQIRCPTAQIQVAEHHQ